MIMLSAKSLPFFEAEGTKTCPFLKIVAMTEKGYNIADEQK
jgi:hypothetical protein